MGDENELTDEEKNIEDAAKLDFTDKSSVEEDGEQPPIPHPWNDDSGVVEIL